MYKATVRWMIRRNIAALNAGDHGPALAMFADDLQFSFPGDNSWATEFRPLERGRQSHVTHRGRAEMERFLQRFVDAGIQMEVEDILVNGPPWNMRAAVRCHVWSPGATATGTRTAPSSSSPRHGAGSGRRRTTRTPNDPRSSTTRSPTRPSPRS